MTICTKKKTTNGFFFIGIKVDANVLYGQNEIGKFIAKLMQENIEVYEEDANDIKHIFDIDNYIPSFVEMWLEDDVIMARLDFPDHGDVDLPIYPTRQIYKALKNELKRD